MLTPAQAGALVARVSGRAAGAVTDTAVALAVGAPVRMRVSIAASLATGRVQRARVTIPDLRVAGLHLAVVDVHAQQLQLVPRWPPHLRAERIVVRVRIEQDSLDRWTRSNALPVRLALRAGVIIARTGIAGCRFGELEIAVRLDRGRLRLAPQRMSMLGVLLNAANAAMPPVTLPLPALPRQAKLVAVSPAVGAIDLAFEMTDLDEPLTADRLRWAARVLRRRAEPVPVTTRHGEAALGTTPLTHRPSATTG